MKQTTRIAVLVACAIIGSLAPEMTADEMRFDVAQDFSTTANPNGVWSYGYETSLGSSFILYTNGGLNNSGLDFWSYDPLGGPPAVAHNPSSNALEFDTPFFYPGEAAFHPGQNGEYSLFRFTAPASGSYRLESLFYGSDKVGTSTDVHVLWNNLPIFAGVVSGFGTNTGPSFNTNLFLQLGDRIDFAVGFGNGSYDYDTTGIEARLIPDSAPVISIRVSEVEVCWTSQTNATYRVEYRSDLTTNMWTTLRLCEPSGGSETCIYDKVLRAEPNRFYRVVVTNCVPEI